MGDVTYIPIEQDVFERLVRMTWETTGCKSGQAHALVKRSLLALGLIAPRPVEKTDFTCNALLATEQGWIRCEHPMHHPRAHWTQQGFAWVSDDPNAYWPRPLNFEDEEN